MTRLTWSLGAVVLMAGLVLQALWWFSDRVNLREAPATESASDAPPQRPPERPHPSKPDREVAAQRAAAIVTAALATQDAKAFSTALQRLEEIGGEAAVRAFYDIAMRRPETRLDMAMRISQIKDRRAATALETVIASEKVRGELAAAAVRALGRMRLRHYVQELCRWATEPGGDDELREAAAFALGEIADPDAIPTLSRLLEEPSATLRRRAIRALGKIVAPASIATLVTFTQRTANEHERALAENALATLRGEPRPFGR